MSIKCNFCNSPALYDAKLKFYGGVWAYVCQDHYNCHGCQVGLGLGTRLTGQGRDSEKAEALK